jgi:hypothetical protein
LEKNEPLHREHLDDHFFSPEVEGSEQHLTKRLICQYLQRLIEDEEKVVELKGSFFKLMNEREVSFQQLF